MEDYLTPLWLNLNHNRIIVVINACHSRGVLPGLRCIFTLSSNGDVILTGLSCALENCRPNGPRRLQPWTQITDIYVGREWVLGAGRNILATLSINHSPYSEVLHDRDLLRWVSDIVMLAFGSLSDSLIFRRED